jgi:ABC-type multidrug transport system fused ATPase/permease subunit
VISETFVVSFRQVPSFGRDGIRRFSANMSEMKRLAARDFEDLLQVIVDIFDVANWLIMIISALFLFLTVYFPNLTTALSFGYYSPAHTGMAWQNSASTPIARFAFWMRRLSTSALSSVRSLLKHALPSIHESSTARWKPVSAVTSKNNKKGRPHKVHLYSQTRVH